MYYHQLKAIEYLQKEKEGLKTNAEKIAERYEEINDKHLEIQKRYEVYVRLLFFPTMSFSLYEVCLKHSLTDRSIDKQPWRQNTLNTD